MLLISASSPARCSSRCRALGHLALQAFLRAQVGQRHRRLRGQGGEQVAVAVVQAAEQAFEVGVEVAQQLLLRD